MNKIFISLILLSLSLLFLNYYANPPDGYTGAPVPDELSCKLCHHFNTKHIIGSTEISGIPEKITPGKIYPVKIIINNQDKKAKRTSFQFTALYHESSVGSLLNPIANVKFSRYKNRNYAESQPGIKINSKETIFYFDWQAPNEPDNSIISFYATSVLADGDNTFANDAVYETETFGILGNSLDVEVIDFANNICRGDSAGYIKIKVSGGSPPYSINWSNGKHNNKITNLKAGLYFATVTDSNGFKGIGKIKISEPDLFAIDSSIVTNFTTNKGGKIEVYATGGTQPYHYYWQYKNNFFSNKQNIYDLNPGKYNLTITDNCNNKLDTMFFIKNKTSIYENNPNDKIILYPIPAKTILHLYSQNYRIKNYSIFNLSKKIITINNLNCYKCNIDVSSMKKGIYFIKFQIKNKTSIQKLIIQ